VRTLYIIFSATWRGTCSDAHLALGRRSMRPSELRVRSAEGSAGRSRCSLQAAWSPVSSGTMSSAYVDSGVIVRAGLRRPRPRESRSPVFRRSAQRVTALPVSDLSTQSSAVGYGTWVLRAPARSAAW